MRPAEFSPEEIVAAGEALVAAGRNVTGFALRQKVGGGNPNRLKQVWDEHLAAKNTTEAEPVAELPVEVAEEVAAVTKSLTERLATLAVELNDKAVKAAERRVAEVLRTAGEQREQAERELKRLSFIPPASPHRRLTSWRHGWASRRRKLNRWKGGSVRLSLMGRRRLSSWPSCVSVWLPLSKLHGPLLMPTKPCARSWMLPVATQA